MHNFNYVTDMLRVRVCTCVCVHTLCVKVKDFKYLVVCLYNYT